MFIVQRLLKLLCHNIKYFTQKPKCCKSGYFMREACSCCSSKCAAGVGEKCFNTYQYSMPTQCAPGLGCVPLKHRNKTDVAPGSEIFHDFDEILGWRYGVCIREYHLHCTTISATIVQLSNLTSTLLHMMRGGEFLFVHQKNQKQ